MEELKKKHTDLEMEIESLKKTQRETALEMEKLGKRSGVTDTSITYKYRGRISGTENTIEDMDTIAK